MALLSQLSMPILEANILPDVIVRGAVRFLLTRRLRELSEGGLEKEQERLDAFVAELKTLPIAIHTKAANTQHYEVPTEYYDICLGQRKKYSCCIFPTPSSTLEDAEAFSLALSCERAELRDGMSVLDLGCGWGSLTLWIAEKFPRCQVTAVSNSRTQREYIERVCREKGFADRVKVITADINDFCPPGSLLGASGTGGGATESTTAAAATTDTTASSSSSTSPTGGVGQFDRVMSVEMMEHVKNYEALLQRISTWLKPSGKLFVHIFTHRSFSYHFEDRDATDWMARYFFSGGTMPSADLLLHFQKHMKIARRWKVNGQQYSRTLEAWLQRTDKNITEVQSILARVYGQEHVRKWTAYHRLFFIACSELFNMHGGEEWFVSHYLFEK